MQRFASLSLLCWLLAVSPLAAVADDGVDRLARRPGRCGRWMRRRSWRWCRRSRACDTSAARIATVAARSDNSPGRCERPDEVACRFCGHRYPSDKYPMTEAVTVRNPRGEPARFEYWADDDGYRYFFNARRDDEIRGYLARQTLQLALLYEATGDAAYGRRAGVLLDRFAQVFPGWCYHTTIHFGRRKSMNGAVAADDFRPGFRTARWNWWAYHDIPLDLVEAYRLLRPSGILAALSAEQGVDVPRQIEHDLLRNAGDQVLANRDTGSNMSPSAWRAPVKLGRVVGEPRYVHEVVRRLRRFADEKFLYDGFWHEGARQAMPGRRSTAWIACLRNSRAIPTRPATSTRSTARGSTSWT